MPAHDAHRIFLSTVTAEFGRYRMELAKRFDLVSVKAVFQEEFEYADVDLVEKLYRLIVPCDVVIHFVGTGAGATANSAAVEDFLQRSHQRGEDFMGFWKDLRGDRASLDALTYTQWEAVLALFLKKHFMPLKPAGAVTDGHPLDKSPFLAGAGELALQKNHLAWLGKSARRYPQDIAEAGGSYLEDAFHKIAGFLMRDCPSLAHAAKQLERQITQNLATPRFLHHAAELFLGREDELKLLDQAWDDLEHKTNVLGIIAWGGVGKTALLAEWIKTRFAKRQWKGDGGKPELLAYFDWSFYEQGTVADEDGEGRVAVRTGNVGDFFEKALTFFGDPDPNKPGKGERLAGLVRRQRALVILDGLEPLQYPFNHPALAGRIIDSDLDELLRGLAMMNPGLCVVTSRQPLKDLSGWAGEMHLEELPIAMAVLLLRQLKVKGTDEELAEACEAFGRHALSLTLLGRFLSDVHKGDIRKWRQIDLQEANDVTRDRKRDAWKVLQTYETWLASGEGRPEELAALRLTGLFDRPAKADCLKVLREAPGIPGLTEALVGLNDVRWRALLMRLESAHLVSLREEDGGELGLDAHPLIREYFAKQLRERQPEAFQTAHSRIFDHLCGTTEHWPEGLDGLQPLYQAVVHGCLAGRQQETRKKVYLDRILRGDGIQGFYSIKNLGAIGSDLGAVAAFFDQPWSRVSPVFSKAIQAWLFNIAAYHLRALGRLAETLEPTRAGLEMDILREDWKNAAMAASNLSELEVTLGLLGDAVADARRAIDFADHSGDAFLRMGMRTTAADALQQSGGREEARGSFEEAEEIQRERQPEYPLLYSLQGFRFCDLLLGSLEQVTWQVVGKARSPRQSGTVKSTVANSDERCREVQSPCLTALAEAERRGNKMMEWRIPNDALLDIALDHLTLARAALYRVVLEAREPSAYENPDLPAALSHLRKANRLDFLPLALLTAAIHHHFIGEPDTARRFLDEAQQIAERGPMPLHLADVHLHRARLFRDKGELEKARVLIEKHGYGRRREELEDAEGFAAGWEG